MTTARQERRKPGSVLMTIGLALFAFGAAIVLLTLGQTKTEVTYSDVTGWGTVSHWVGPAPLPIFLAVLGLILAAIGYGRRRISQ